MKRKVMIISGSRADYGLLRMLTQRFMQDPDFEIYFAATGSHLSEKHGKTVQIIRQDQINNILEIDMKLEGDQPADISQSLSNGIMGFSKIYTDIKPECIIVLGDRYELWSACMPATIHNIPIVHIHGGESTRGVIDEAIRHSITKMSHLHFCSHDEYKNRILRMGEEPSRVHVVGAIGLDRIKKMTFLSRSEIENRLGTSFAKQNILCTFHPVTLDTQESKNETLGLVQALQFQIQNSESKVFITMPNADTNSSFIRIQLENLTHQYPGRIHSFVNLGDQLYLSLMKEVDLIVGNSSSGILEAPYLKKAVVDIGLRQEGRLRSAHVLHSEGSFSAIQTAIQKALSHEFQKQLEQMPSLYGDGHATVKIYDVIKKTDFKTLIFKTFYDGPIK